MDPLAAHPPTGAAEISDESQQREEYVQQQQPPSSSSSHGSRPAQGEMSQIPPSIPTRPVKLLPEGAYPTSRMMRSPPSNMSLGYGDRPEGGASAMPGFQRGAEGPFMGDPRRRATSGSDRMYGRTRASDPARRSVVEEHRYTIAQRLKPTQKYALENREKFKKRARILKWAINVAIGLQVFLGALTTGVAAIQLTGKQLGIATTVLGIFATLVGAFLGRMRSSEEPESSLIRARDLDSLWRRSEAFVLDHGHEVGNDEVNRYRHELETLLNKKSLPAPAPKPEAKSGQVISA